MSLIYDTDMEGLLYGKENMSESVSRQVNYSYFTLQNKLIEGESCLIRLGRQ
jgi:hypothetical protein